VAERFQQFGTLYGDLHRKIRPQRGIGKVARQSAFGKGRAPFGRLFPGISHSK
jgi:hypothetical protein